MSNEQYRVPVDQLEGESRVARQDQVVLVGHGVGSPTADAVAPPVADDTGDGH